MRGSKSMRRFLTGSLLQLQLFEIIKYHQLKMKLHQEDTGKRMGEAFKHSDVFQYSIFYEGQVFDVYCLVSNLTRDSKVFIILTYWQLCEGHRTGLI